MTAKWGNNLAIRLPKTITQKLGIQENEKLVIDLRDNTIVITKPRKKRTIDELVLEKTGLSLDEYVKSNPYDGSDYIHTPRAGNEVLGD